MASAEAAIGLGPGDVLLAVGSLVEGLGTSKSDIDLLLISGREANATVPEMELGWILERCIVDVRVVRPEVVAGLITRLRQWAGEPWNLTQLASFGADERLLLHRLLHGCQLFPASSDAAAPYRPPRAALARLKLQVARHMARTIQVDMMGYRDNLDHYSLAYAAQELLGQAVDGLLAAYHLTNPYPKWRSRLLDSLPAAWNRPLWIRPTDLSPGQAIWQLHRAPADPARGAGLVHALRCAAFARAAFAWAEPRLVEDRSPCQVPRAWDPGRPPRGAVLPNLDLDVDFFASDAGVAIARLNEFGASLTVSEREFPLLLLFDGVTTAGEAAVALGAPPAGGPGPVDVERIAGMAVEAGLCVRPREIRDCLV